MADESVTHLLMSRDKLAEVMEDCDGCAGMLVDEVSDADLGSWLVSHRINPDTLVEMSEAEAFERRSMDIYKPIPGTMDDIVNG
jgi:hypothetical protein